MHAFGPAYALFVRAKKMTMKSLLLLSILFFTFNCSPISQSNQEEAATFEPFSILSIESNLVEIKYVITGYTKSIPPRTMRREDSYIYDLVFRLSFKTDIDTWSEPIYVTIERADNTVEVLNYDDELSQLTDNIFPEYVVQLEVKKKGNIRATLGYLDGKGKVIFDKINPYRTKIVTLK